MQTVLNMSEKQKTICIIGAGFSGIGAAIKVKENLSNVDFTIFDENKQVGGTWALHTYPNCGSDIPVHLYSFSFAQKPDWTSLFGNQKDIHAYFEDICEKHGLYKNIKFNQQVVKLCWVEEDRKWSVWIRDKSTGSLDKHSFDYVIAGPGAFRRPILPEMYRNFKGPVIHTGEWNDQVKLDDKTIGIVGSGTSAIQVVPAVVSIAKKVYSFQRRPAWVVPKPEFSFPEWIHWIFKHIPFVLTIWRTILFVLFEIVFFAFRPDSLLNRFGAWIAKVHLKRQIPNNPDLREKLLPDYQFACKRMGVSNEYWRSLGNPNVEVVLSKIESVTEDSIVTSDGEEYKMDVIVLATGYAVQDYFNPVEMIGVDAHWIQRVAEAPNYFGIMLDKAPNLFFLWGPNSGVLHSTNVFNIECQINWVCNVIGQMGKEGYTRVQIKPDAAEKFMDDVDEEMKRMVYSVPACASWYTTGTGRVNAFYSSNCLSYWKQTRNVDYSKLMLS